MKLSTDLAFFQRLPSCGHMALCKCVYYY